MTPSRIDRQSWTSRALTPDERIVDPRCESYRCGFWILSDKRRVGTLAIDTGHGARLWLRLSSLYLFPSERGRGIAADVLRAAQQAVVEAGFAGIRVGTHWTWQTAVRFYLWKLGMLACSFKRSIDFAWVAGLLPHRIDVQEREARLAVATSDSGWTDLVTATSRGEWLVWEESPLMNHGERTEGGVVVDPMFVRATFALALAVNGWPLLRSQQMFDDAAGYDLGGPEVLAHKIGIFEYLDRGYGFEVQTPRIPGLPYDAIAKRLATD